MRFITLGSALAFTASSVLASVSDLPYLLVDVQWIGEFQGQAYNVSGTAETLVAHFQSIDPSYTVDSVALVDSTTRAALVERDANTLCCPVPGQNWGRARIDAIEDGIRYLTKLNRDITSPARTCGRISCSSSGGIYWCNDNNFPITQGSAWLGAHVSTIVNSCLPPGGGGGYFCGQNFDPGNFNLIARADSC